MGNIVILFWGLVAGELGLLAYFLFLSAKKRKEETVEPAEKEEFSGLKHRVALLQDELQRIKTDYSASRSELQALQKKESELNRKLIEQKESHASKKAEFDLLSREKAQIQEALAGKENELARLTSQSSSQETTLSEANKQIACLQDELKTSKAGYETAKAQFQQRLAGKEEELSKLSSQSSAEKGELTGLKEQVITLQKELERTKIGYAAAQNELGAIRALLEQKESSAVDIVELERLKKEKSELEQQLADKQQEVEKMIARASQDFDKEEGKRQFLEKENKLLSEKLAQAEEEIKRLEEAKEMRDKVLSAYKQSSKKGLRALTAEEEVEVTSQREKAREQKKQKIGEILLTNKFITQDILDKALEYQSRFGGTLTQYLLAYGYIDEDKLAQCLCTQFGIPYLPLKSYDIPYEIIKLIPVDVVERYWIIPVDKIGNILTVVMADPLNTQAIKEIEEVTGCRVQVFLGLISEIIEALQDYYKIAIEGRGVKTKTGLPFFIDTKTYKGLERRQSIRFNSRININFTEQGDYKVTKTKDVSRDGLSFESETALPVGSLLALKIDLPKEVSPLPIAAVVQVVRLIPLKDSKYEIGVKIVKISEQELNTILEYASTHREDQQR